MSDEEDPLCIAFEGVRRIASGPLSQVRPVVQAAMARAEAPVLVFDAETSRPVEIAPAGAPEVEPRGRGRPKLGVTSREVTLLPRHWEWLARQPGGASAALRRLVDAARRTGEGADLAREAREAAYRFMSAMAGDLPGFEEAARALFRGDGDHFGELVASWPADVCDHLLELARPGLRPWAGPPVRRAP